MLLAIVILNWNGADLLHRYLPSVIQNSQEEGVRVIVADNASTDNSLEVLRTEFPDIQVLQLSENYGFAEGYNRALRRVDADYYLLLNSDVEIRQSHWLQPMLRYMQQHPHVAACQPKLLALRQPDHFEYAGAAGGYIDKFGYPFCRGRIFDHVEADHGQYDTIAPIHWATGAALLVSSQAYWEVGGLDSRFFAHQEEIDLCWRLRSRGYTLVCIPESTAYHLGGASLAQGNPRKTFLNFRNNLFLLYKNLPTRTLRIVLPIRLILDGVAALKFLLTLDVPNFRAVLKAHCEFHRLHRKFAADRENNLAHRQPLRSDSRNSSEVQRSLPECAPFSLLWQTYVRRITFFSRLPRF